MSVDVNLGSTSVGGVDWQLTSFRGLIVGPPLFGGGRVVRDCLGMKFEGDAVRGGWGSRRCLRRSKQLHVGLLYIENNKHKKHCDRLN